MVRRCYGFDELIYSHCFIMLAISKTIFSRCFRLSVFYLFCCGCFSVKNCCCCCCLSFCCHFINCCPILTLKSCRRFRQAQCELWEGETFGLLPNWLMLLLFLLRFLMACCIFIFPVLNSRKCSQSTYCPSQIFLVQLASFLTWHMIPSRVCTGRLLILGTHA